MKAKARDFDRKFDEGGKVAQRVDLKKARRPGYDLQRVSLRLPVVWVIQLLDKEANRLRVPRQSIIKVWVAERLEKAS